jgi:5-methylcytosine-specific restriction endonuclease McrA
MTLTPEINTEEMAQHVLRRCSELRRDGVSLNDRCKQMEVEAFEFMRSHTHSVGFYKSPAWRSLRYEVLKERGRRCECCGCTPSDGREVHVDHIEPRSKNPARELDKSNLQILCADCNLGKSNTDSIAWGQA